MLIIVSKARDVPKRGQNDVWRKALIT